MSADTAFDALSRQLSGADDKTLLKIVQVVDRLGKRGSLDRLLEQHRMRLAVIRPPRPITLPRLFVLPFEELLVDAAAWTPGLMRVPRDRLGRLITLTFNRLAADRVAELKQSINGRCMDDASAILEIGRDFWPLCAAAVAETVNHGRQSKDQEVRELQVPLRIAQHLLPVAEAVVTTVWALPPKPMFELDAAAKQKIAELLGLASAAGRDCFQLTAELLVNRSELPLSVIEPVIDGSFELGARERQQAAAMIAEACQSDMVRLFRALAARSGQAEPKTLVGPLQALVSNVESLQEVAAKVKFDHRELRRLKADVFELIEQRLDQALHGELFLAFEALADAQSQVDWRGLEQNAAAAANMRLMAKRIGLASKIDFIFTKAFDRYNHVLQAAERAAGGSMVDPVTMDRVRIIELMFGSRAAMQVLTPLRRGKAESGELRQNRASGATRSVHAA